MKQNILRSLVILLITISTSSCDAITWVFGPAKTTPLKVVGTPVVETPVVYTTEASGVGLNVWFLSYWDGSASFVDAMKHSSRWFDLTGNAVATVDTYGWPTQDAQVVVSSAMIARVWNGTYHLVFNGQGDISLGGTSFPTKTYDAGTNQTSATVTINITDDSKTDGVDTAVYLRITNSKRTASSAVNTGVTNVRLYRPGYGTAPTKIFTDPVVNTLKTAGMIRTMDWVNVNRNTIVKWEDRTTPLHSSQDRTGSPKLVVDYPSSFTYTDWNTSYGVALEHMVQLCNEANADIWMNVPFAADNTYVEKMFQLLKYGSNGVDPYTSSQATPLYPPLKSGLRIYVEYGNENWNTLYEFHSNPYIKDKVYKLPSSDPVLADYFDSDKNSSTNIIDVSNDYYNNMAINRYATFRTAQISDIARTVFPSDMMTRVRPVICTQQGDANETLSGSLKWADQYYRVLNNRELKDIFYGGGGSAYYGFTDNSSKDPNTLYAPSNYPDKVFVKNNQIDSIWIYNYGLKRVAYEGGISLDGVYTGTFNPDATVTQAIMNLNADTRMKDVMEKTHIAWAQTGGDVLTYYCLYGGVFWEFFPDPTLIDTPKMQALNNIKTNPRAAVTMGGALPGTISALELNTSINTLIKNFDGYATTVDTESVWDGMQLGNFLVVPGHSASEFTGELTVRGARYAEGSTKIGIWINGTKAGSVTLAKNGGLANSTPLTVTIPEGLVAVRVEVEDGPDVGDSLTLHSITVTVP